jgi:hypothetical protein
MGRSHWGGQWFNPDANISFLLGCKSYQDFNIARSADNSGVLAVAFSLA